jgi:hypothetical protein
MKRPLRFIVCLSQRWACLLALALLIGFSSAIANGECNQGVKAPESMDVAGVATGTKEKLGTVTIGPGGPVYARVKNTGDVSASFGVLVRKKGAPFTQARCNTASVIAPNDEYWLEARSAGDELAERNVDVFTGVEGANLELTVFKSPNLLPSSFSDKVTLRLRAFIPKDHPTNPGYVRPVPSPPGSWMIPGPLPEFIKLLPVDSIKAAADCFLTDNRGFSSERSAAFNSKVWSDFSLVVSYGQVSIEPMSGVHRAGLSTRVNCSKGQIVAEKPGLFDGPFGVRALGRPTAEDGKVEVIGQAAIGNPHVLGAPMIDYSFDFICDLKTKRLTYALTVGTFPAFEIYAFRANGTPITILQVVPAAETAWGLTDGGIGLITTKRYTGEVQL